MNLDDQVFVNQESNEKQEEVEEVEEQDEPVPLLYVDVNLGNNLMKRIVMYEGDDPEEKATEFAIQNKLDDQMLEKLKELLKRQINGVLGRIDEDEETDEEHNS